MHGEGSFGENENEPVKNSGQQSILFELVEGNCVKREEEGKSGQLLFLGQGLALSSVALHS